MDEFCRELDGLITTGMYNLCTKIKKYWVKLRNWYYK